MKNITILFSLFTLLHISVYSQSTGYDQASNAFSYELILTPTGQVQNLYDTVYTASCEIQLTDIAAIKKIHIKVKKQDTGLDMINEKIDLQNTSSASVPVQINQNIVTIVLGDIINKGLEFDIKMQDQNDNESQSIIRNY